MPERRNAHVLVAYHEAGHAIVMHFGGGPDPVHKISIVARGAAGGYTRALPLEDRVLVTRGQFDAMLAAALGGRAAELVVCGELTTGSQSDIAMATELATRMVTVYGMSEHVGPVALADADGHAGRVRVGEQRELSEGVVGQVDQEIRRLVGEAHARAERILREHRGALDRVASELLRVETLDGERLRPLVFHLAWGVGPVRARAEECPIAYYLSVQPIGGVRRIPRRDDVDSVPRGDDALVVDVVGGGPGAESALSLLYDRYGGAVYGLALRVTGSASDAEEVLQDTFWSVWRHAGTYEPGRVRFATWLLRIAHNRAVSALRRRGARPPLDRSGRGGGEAETTLVAEQADTAPSPFEQTWQAHLRQVLRQALLALPPEQAHALELAYFGGLSHTQIAAAQGAPPSTVKTRLALALKKLAVRLEGSGVGVDALAVGQLAA